MGPNRLTREAARRLDADATSIYGIPSLLLMENAAFGLRTHVMEMLQGWTLIVCGPGNNGGDGLALARQLSVEGVDVVVALAGAADAFGGDAAVNMMIVDRMRLPTIDASDVELDRLVAKRGAPGVVVDALFGTGLTRPIEGRLAATVAWINRCGARVLAVDIPSGLDADAGRPLGATVRAERTVTFVAPKVGFDALEAQDWIGEVHVAGIGAPASLLAAHGAGSGCGRTEGRLTVQDPGPRGRSV